jgi:hypothetical protein
MIDYCFVLNKILSTPQTTVKHQVISTGENFKITKFPLNDYITMIFDFTLFDVKFKGQIATENKSLWFDFEKPSGDYQTRLHCDCLFVQLDQITFTAKQVLQLYLNSNKIGQSVEESLSLLLVDNDKLIRALAAEYAKKIL